jgi:hypothetical protein
VCRVITLQVIATDPKISQWMEEPQVLIIVLDRGASADARRSLSENTIPRPSLLYPTPGRKALSRSSKRTVWNCGGDTWFDAGCTTFIETTSV